MRKSVSNLVSNYERAGRVSEDVCLPCRQQVCRISLIHIYIYIYELCGRQIGEVVVFPEPPLWASIVVATVDLSAACGSKELWMAWLSLVAHALILHNKNLIHRVNRIVVRQD